MSMQNQDEEDFRFLAENSADMVCRVGLDLVMHYASPSCERLLGWKPEEMIGKGPDAFVLAEDLPVVAAAHERLSRDGVDPVPTEVRMRRKDGTYAWMEVNARMVQGDGSKEPLGIVLVMRDISQRKLREDAQHPPPSPSGVSQSTLDPALKSEWERTLHESDERFSRAFAMTPLPMAVAVLAGFQIIDVNEAFSVATGYVLDELVGRNASEIRVLDDSACRQMEMMFGKTDSVRDVATRLRTRDGVFIDCILSAELTTVDAQRCILVAFQDVTERKHSEDELMIAIETVMKDTTWFSRAVVEKLAQLRQPARTDKPEGELADLTSREREVLGLMCEGQNDGEIALSLGLSRNTVRNHVSRIYSKIGVHHRAAAVVWARERGILAHETPRRPTTRRN
jgi:PAS domain S-box-containing protein